VTHTETVTSTETVTTGSVTSAKPCQGTDLAATFTLVPNSAGAGQIAYTLTVKNTSQSPCSVRGIPQGTLLGATGTVLPTGASAAAQARFSPDVAGQGDSQSGSCQPEAHTFQLSTAGGVTEAPIKPPTSVCQRGTIHFESFGYTS
jgi:hypothetical protein